MFEYECFYPEDECYYTMAELFCAATPFEQQYGSEQWQIIDSDDYTEPTYLAFIDGSEAVLDYWGRWEPL